MHHFQGSTFANPSIITKNPNKKPPPRYTPKGIYRDEGNLRDTTLLLDKLSTP